MVARRRLTRLDRVNPMREDSTQLPASLWPAESHFQIASQSPQVAQMQAYSSIANGGLPNKLQAGIESLSGMTMDDVRVHYNSSKPAQLQAHAYAQGSEIHLAPGQEKHLAHEAWHVVQQKQGRVKPTLQMKGVAINDDAGLEREADRMGSKAMEGGAIHSQPTLHKQGLIASAAQLVQRVVIPITNDKQKVTGARFQKSDIEATQAGYKITIGDKKYAIDGMTLLVYQALDENATYVCKIGMGGKVTFKRDEEVKEAMVAKKAEADKEIKQEQDAAQATSDGLTAALAQRTALTYAGSYNKHAKGGDADSKVVAALDNDQLKAFAEEVLGAKANRKTIQEDDGAGTINIRVDIGSGECLVVSLTAEGAAHVFHIGPGAGVA